MVEREGPQSEGPCRAAKQCSLQCKGLHVDGKREKGCMTIFFKCSVHFCDTTIAILSNRSS
jgi:hypothetical protein